MGTPVRMPSEDRIRTRHPPRQLAGTAVTLRVREVPEDTWALQVRQEAGSRLRMALRRVRTDVQAARPPRGRKTSGRLSWLPPAVWKA